jgi:fatty-acyl-CoA synthase
MDSTMQDFPLTVTGILRHGTALYADRRVITKTPDGYREISYGELAPRVAQLAHGLQSLGISGDQRVATFLWNNQEHLESYFAIPSMGAVLHTLNLRLPGEQLTFIANQAQDQVIIADLSVAPLLAPVLSKMDSVHTVVAVGAGDIDALTASGKTVVRYDELLSGQPTSYDWPDLDEKSAAAMCYTSGTTGNPKGVVYSHRSTYLHSMSLCAANAVGVMSGDRVLPIVPMFHANAWGQPYTALMAGADLLMPDRFLQAEPLIDMIEDKRPTVAAAVPTIWNDVLHFLRAHPDRDISSLRTVCCGGSAVPLAMMKAYEENYGVPIHQGWGMTETSPLAALAMPPVDAPEDQKWPLRNTAGRLLCGVEGRRGRCPPQRRRVGRRSGGPRSVGNRVVLPERRRVEVPRRMASHRRRRTDRQPGLHHPGGPRQGCHQVRGRMDFIRGPGELDHGAPVRRRGMRGRRPRRPLAGKTVGRCGR